MILKNAVIKGELKDIAFENGKILDAYNANNTSIIDLNGKKG